MTKTNSQVQAPNKASKKRKTKLVRRVNWQKGNPVDLHSNIEDDSLENPYQCQRPRYCRTETYTFEYRSPNDNVINRRPVLSIFFPSPVGVDSVLDLPTLPNFEMVSGRSNSQQGRFSLVPRLASFSEWWQWLIHWVSVRLLKVSTSWYIFTFQILFNVLIVK